MSNEEHNEYMRDVKWKTALAIFGSAASILIALVWFCSDIKESIKDTGINADKHLTSAVTSINRKQDSLQHLNDLQFLAIWDAVDNIKPPVQEKKYQYKVAPQQNGCMIERYVDGHLTRTPIKCP